MPQVSWQRRKCKDWSSLLLFGNIWKKEWMLILSTIDRLRSQTLSLVIKKKKKLTNQRRSDFALLLISEKCITMLDWFCFTRMVIILGLSPVKLVSSNFFYYSFKIGIPLRYWLRFFLTKCSNFTRFHSQLLYPIEPFLFRSFLYLDQLSMRCRFQRFWEYSCQCLI